LAYVVARTWTNVTLVILSTVTFITVGLVSAKSEGSQIFALTPFRVELSRITSIINLTKLNK